MDAFGGDFLYRAGRLQRAGPVAVATLQTLDAQPTRSGIRIGSSREADEVGLVLDDGKQCFLALPFAEPHPALLSLRLLPSHTMELCADPKLLLLQILCWKAQS